MPTAAPLSPSAFKRWDLWVLILLLAVSLFLAIRDRAPREAQPVLMFLERAGMIEDALERFAEDHGGAYPPDGHASNRPPGLSDKYIKWDPAWLIDYEVHPNGKGGRLVCLEFIGPQGVPIYRALCRKPELRRDYGRGQAIPKTNNRIWVIAEDAKILDKPK